jgi:hypothetical protein
MEKSKYRKEYYLKNKGRENKNSKKYYATHKKYFHKKWKAYYNQNKDRLLIYWKEKHKETRKQDSKKEKERLHKDNNFRTAKYLRNYVKKAFKQYYYHQKLWSISKYPLDYGKIVLYLFKTRPQDYDVQPNKYEIDHIKPLCSFDLNDWSNIKKAFQPKNHQWLNPKLNCKKAKRDRKKSIW